MAFYTDISLVYDDLFPVSPEQRALFVSLMDDGGARTVVDCGCGTGSQLQPFAVAGLSCFGFDLDPSLVAIARRKLAAYPKTRIEMGSFADLSALVSLPSDLLMCLGNSLVHVPQDEASRFFADAAKALSGSGTLLLQILNYERLLREEVTELPMLRASEGIGGVSAEVRMGGRSQGVLPDLPPVRRRGRAADRAERDPPVPGLPRRALEDAGGRGLRGYPFLRGFRAV